MTRKDRRLRSRREQKKQPVQAPLVPDLGRVAMPHKHDKKTAEAIASGRIHWDDRHIGVKANKHRRRRDAAAAQDPRKRPLPKGLRLLLLEDLQEWTFDASAQVFLPPQEHLEKTGLKTRALQDFENAARTLQQDEAVTVRIAGINNRQARSLARRLPAGSKVIRAAKH